MLWLETFHIVKAQTFLINYLTPMSCSINLHFQQQIYSSVATVASICTQFITLLMDIGSYYGIAPPPTETQWNDVEIIVLLDYLFLHYVEGSGSSNFKPSTYEDATTSVSHLWMTGAKKNSKMCKTKWNMVYCDRHKIIIHTDETILA